jgi:hypothetical protein
MQLWSLHEQCHQLRRRRWGLLICFTCLHVPCMQGLSDAACLLCMLGAVNFIYVQEGRILPALLACIRLSVSIPTLHVPYSTVLTMVSHRRGAAAVSS